MLLRLQKYFFGWMVKFSAKQKCSHNFDLPVTQPTHCEKVSYLARAGIVYKITPAKQFVSAINRRKFSVFCGADSHASAAHNSSACAYNATSFVHPREFTKALIIYAVEMSACIIMMYRLKDAESTLKQRRASPIDPRCTAVCLRLPVRRNQQRNANSTTARWRGAIPGNYYTFLRNVG